MLPLRWAGKWERLSSGSSVQKFQTPWLVIYILIPKGVFGLAFFFFKGYLWDFGCEMGFSNVKVIFGKRLVLLFEDQGNGKDGFISASFVACDVLPRVGLAPREDGTKWYFTTSPGLAGCV